MVRGATGFVSGYAPASDNGLVMAVADTTSFTYYKVDLTTAVASKLSVSQRGTGEGSLGYYAGYFRGLSADGSTAYRVGWSHVTTGQNGGVDAVVVGDGSRNDASVEWLTVPLADGHGLPIAARAYPGAGNGSFIGVAPVTKDGKLSAVSWDASGAKVMCTWSHAEFPRTPLGDLGYVGVGTNKNTIGVAGVKYGLSWK